MTQEETFSLLIPRYLRGELSEAETAEFEAYLGENPDFQADIEFQRNLMAARPEQNDASSLEFGWARLSRSIDDLEAESPEALKLETRPLNKSGFPAMWKVAALVLACTSIGQAFYITNSQTKQQYQLASEDAAQGVTLQLSFGDDVNVKDVSDVLVRHDSQIIAGPSKLGIYTLSFSDNEACSSMISTLISEGHLVDSYTSCTTDSKG